MIKANIAKNQAPRRSKAIRGLFPGNDNNPLPGRKPSAAFIAALQAVAKMREKKEQGLSESGV